MLVDKKAGVQKHRTRLTTYRRPIYLHKIFFVGTQKKKLVPSSGPDTASRPPGKKLSFFLKIPEKKKLKKSFSTDKFEPYGQLF